MKKLVLLVLVVLTLAASPSSFVWGPFEGESTSSPVEQQTQGGATQPDQSLWVVSPPNLAPPGQGDWLRRCAWDSDDSRSFIGSGNIGPGETVVGAECAISDWGSSGIYVYASARSPDLVVTLRFDPQGSSFTLTAPARAQGNNYVYEVCANGMRYDRSSPDLQPIPDSGYGGVGVVTTVSVVVHNPTTRTIRDVGAYFRLRVSSNSASAGRCPTEPLANRIGVYPGPFLEWEVPG